jgi:hypothetical protein
MSSFWLLSDLEQRKSVSSAIQHLCKMLEECKVGPSIEDLRSLGLAMHGVMCDKNYPALDWMPITFEDVACELRGADENAKLVEQEKEQEHERKINQYRMNGGM